MSILMLYIDASTYTTIDQAPLLLNRAETPPCQIKCQT